ncbi:glycosyltransferase [Alloacidobacterium sp.]|uniref:glycosyltransferase n=1 Tax=Alloacidobacterium sp. TaxID=2951999 RepID=UPI002D283209|nr:glycosyltransferase [Alloacidobacterium sp.]HYK37308.1 glycosyltransferase [Alloacidobacterium sp.]
MILMGLGILGLISSTVFNGLVFAGAFRFVAEKRKHRKTLQENFHSAVSLLKPLHGDEPNLDAHIASFFEQDYPDYEILFCARAANDAGLQTARSVAARYPSIPAKFLTTGENTYMNAKVSSLEKMAAAASTDIFIISDSDVRVTPDYIREVVAPFATARVGAVTCLYRGVADEGLWSKLEAAGMSIEMTSGVLAANLMEGMQFTLGPTMAVRRSCVNEMGGFGYLGPYCADDFVLGNQIAAHGHEVVLSDHVIDHIVLNLSFMASIKHQVRWMKSTRFSRPKGHFGTSLTFAVPFGLLAGYAAWWLHRPYLALALIAYSVVTRVVMAAVIGKTVVAERHLLRTTLLYPLRDLMGFFYWAASYASSKILWRGRVYRLTEGGLMKPAQQKSDQLIKQPVDKAVS